MNEANAENFDEERKNKSLVITIDIPILKLFLNSYIIDAIK